MAFKLTAMHYICGILITFEDPSEITAAFPEYGLGVENFLSSRLLNRQVKEAMHSVLRAEKHRLLIDLEQGLKEGVNDKMAWVRHLCVMLLVCTWIEDVEVAADAFLYNIGAREGGNFDTVRTESRVVGEDLEKTFFNLVGIFHNMSKTRRDPKSRSKADVVTFNPIKCPESTAELPTWDAQRLVKELGRLTLKYSKLWIPG
jgi:hypothetical protein